MTEKNKIYFDYAATTPVDEEVRESMNPYFSEKFGNPGSLHKFGQEAIKALDGAREKVADILETEFDRIIFTGSATEANNLAIRGTVRQAIQSGEIQNPKIITSAIEHDSVLSTVHDLDEEIEVVEVGVNKKGKIDLAHLEEELTEDTVLVSVMQANNEIGTVQPISEIADLIENFRGSRNYPLFHTDAVQAFQYIPSIPQKLGVDLMTLSAHKIYGPKGVGLLYVKNKDLLSPLMTGGGQEFGIRSGTENVPLIVGFSKALELAHSNRKEEKKKMKDLGRFFFDGVKEVKSSIKINGFSPEERFQDSELLGIPNIYNLYFPENSAEDLLMKFDMKGIATNTGSACSARSAESSHVLEALGFSAQRTDSSLRFSFGKYTTKEQLKNVLEVFEEILE